MTKCPCPSCTILVPPTAWKQPSLIWTVLCSAVSWTLFLFGTTADNPSWPCKTCCHFRELFTWRVALRHCYLPREIPHNPELPYWLRNSVWEYPPVKNYLQGIRNGDITPWQGTSCDMNSKEHPLHKRWSNQKDQECCSGSCMRNAI
jgi:hypothetical protein